MCMCCMRERYIEETVNVAQNINWYSYVKDREMFTVLFKL